MKTFAFKYWSPILSKTVTLNLGQYDDMSLTDARKKVAGHRKEIARDEDPRAKSPYNIPKPDRTRRIQRTGICPTGYIGIGKFCKALHREPQFVCTD
jgi:hypothetical protein